MYTGVHSVFPESTEFTAATNSIPPIQGLVKYTKGASPKTIRILSLPLVGMLPLLSGVDMVTHAFAVRAGQISCFQVSICHDAWLDLTRTRVQLSVCCIHCLNTFPLQNGNINLCRHINLFAFQCAFQRSMRHGLG